MSPPREPVTVFLPTWNAGSRLEAVLDAVQSQRTERPLRLRAIDSGSSDGTRDVLARHGVECTRIEQRDFDHGGTRNRGVLESGTELVVLLTQDARPADSNWLEELLAPFDDPLVAGCWSRQVPRPGCHPFQRANLAAHMGTADSRRVVEPLSPAEWAALSPTERVARLGFDDVSSAVRRSAVERVPFPATSFGEDMAWARAVLLAGYRLVFAGRSQVEHSHDVTRAEFYDRVLLTHAQRRRLTDFEPLPTRGHALTAARLTARHLLRSALLAHDLPAGRRLLAAAQAVPYALLQVTATRRGARRARYEPPEETHGESLDGIDGAEGPLTSPTRA